ncbi:MAG TPA: 50S ribosomal protein L9 [Firmicutes bacterium]|nr:50S ribosomal protein L9 [Bacillota bacterium]HBM70686.1 50S ribosomal protein L9 [Bacillota bacterium]HBX25603.1 50S ribosomal protein L9 [Bacillota bacterium]
MKVILLADVKKLGKKGETIEVSDGYGSNYLIPRGLATPSTVSSQKELAKNNALEEARQIQLKKEAEELAKRLEHINVEFKAKVGSDGRMFGSISPKEIEEGMEKQWGIKIDKRKFLDKYPANAIGYTRLKIELYKGSQGVVTGVVNVHISEEK